MATPNKTERKKIKIKTIFPPRPILGKEGLEVVEFMGEDNVKYEVWSKTLVAELKEGGEIDADIVYSVKETEQGVFYHNKITQIYVNGQPVRGKQGGKGYHSPEERLSIESQVAVKAVVDLRVAGIIDDKNKLYKKAMKWCQSRIDKTLTMPEPAPTPQPKEEKAPTPRFEGIDNYGQLYEACQQRWGMSRQDVWDELNVKSQDEIIETPADCYKRIEAVRH